MYRRYFESSHNENFAKFLSRNWREEEFEDHDYWRMTLWIQTCLLDIFYSYMQTLIHKNLKIEEQKKGEGDGIGDGAGAGEGEGEG